MASSTNRGNACRKSETIEQYLLDLENEWLTIEPNQGFQNIPSLNISHGLLQLKKAVESRDLHYVKQLLQEKYQDYEKAMAQSAKFKVYSHYFEINRNLIQIVDKRLNKNQEKKRDPSQMDNTKEPFDVYRALEEIKAFLQQIMQPYERDGIKSDKAAGTSQQYSENQSQMKVVNQNVDGKTVIPVPYSQEDGVKAGHTPKVQRSVGGGPRHVDSPIETLVSEIKAILRDLQLYGVKEATPIERNLEKKKDASPMDNTREPFNVYPALEEIKALLQQIMQPYERDGTRSDKAAGTSQQYSENQSQMMVVNQSVDCITVIPVPYFQEDGVKEGHIPQVQRSVGMVGGGPRHVDSPIETLVSEIKAILRDLQQYGVKEATPKESSTPTLRRTYTDTKKRRPQSEKLSSQDISRLKAEIQRLNGEKDYWKNRLSLVTENTLTRNNRTIMDLSDPNRPNKLAEKFGNLYDNNWTEAFVVLRENLDDIDCIKILGGILKLCYRRCEGISIKQMQDAGRVLKTLTMDSTVNQLKEEFPRGLFEARKECADKALGYVQTEVYKQATEKKNKYNNFIPLVPDYVKACTEVCWGMVVQEPKACFSWPPERSDTTVDMDFFSFYTRNGRGIEFAVWPAMLLHENGPLLRKGTVQPYEITPN